MGDKARLRPLEQLIETRVNILKESNVLNYSYLPEVISGTGPSTNVCCWCIAATTIVQSVGSVIMGCAGGPITCAVGGVVAASIILDGTGELCASCGNCSGNGW